MLHFYLKENDSFSCFCVISWASWLRDNIITSLSLPSSYSPVFANNVSINSNIIVKTKPNMILPHEWDCNIIVNKGKTFLTRLEKHRFARTIVTVLFASASFSLIEMSTIMLRMIPISAKDISMKTSLKIVDHNQVGLA